MCQFGHPPIFNCMIMAKYQFGKDITYKFYPLDRDGNPLPLASSAPSIYVYSEKPDRGTVVNEDGTTTYLVGAEITTWSEAGKGKSFTIPAIDDPEPTSANETQDYWVGIRFYLQSSEQQQVELIHLELSRVIGRDETLEVVPEDIKRVFSSVTAYKSDEQLDDYISDAIDDIRSALNNGGFRWAYITELARLRRAVIDKVIVEVCSSEIADGNTGLEDFRNFKLKSFNEKIGSLKFGYDLDNDGEADAEVSRGNTQRIIR